MKPEDFPGMSKQDVQILFLEASLIRSRCEIRVLGDLLAQHLRDSGATGISGLSVEAWMAEAVKKELRSYLPTVADLNADRASKIARILKIDDSQT